MSDQLTYVPVLRLKMQEKAILETFRFGNAIFPCVEIFKQFERQTKNAKKKTFAQTYIPTLSKIAAKKVFVDLPVHLKSNKQMKPEVLEFVSKVLGVRQNRTKFMLELAPLSQKLIPVISTYSQRTGEIGSIVAQENDLRQAFPTLAFRTFENTFRNDIEQVAKVAQPQDYVIVDLEEHLADPSDEFVIQPIIDILATFDKCKVIILSSAIPSDISNTKLEHGKIITKADNCLLKNFALLYGDGFGDYAGIKKDSIIDGGSISPGFIFYDPVENNYYGYKGSEKKELIDFEKIIVPDVYNSDAVKRMQASDLPYLSIQNSGWTILCKILFENEASKNQRKFKRISIEHYLHCIRTKLSTENFFSYV